MSIQQKRLLIGLTNGIKNNNMKTKHLAITFGIVCLLLSICLHYCTPKTQQNNTILDSLTFANKAIEVQLGYALAEVQTQTDRAAKAEMAASQRDTVYLTRIKVIIKQAPDTCQPYLIAMKNECDTLVLAHVNSKMSKDTLIEKQSGVINLYAEKDSVSQLVIGQQGKVINDLTTDNKKLIRKNKVAKFFNKVLVGAAVGFTAVVVYFTSVK